MHFGRCLRNPWVLSTVAVLALSVGVILLRIVATAGVTALHSRLCFMLWVFQMFHSYHHHHPCGKMAPGEADVFTGADVVLMASMGVCSALYVLDTLGVSAGQKAAGTSGALITASEGGFSPCRRVSSGSAPLRSW